MAAVDAAVATDQPMIFACYTPHYVFDLHKITKLSEPAYIDAAWKIVPASDATWISKSNAAVAWPAAHFSIAYATGLSTKKSAGRAVPRQSGFHEQGSDRDGSALTLNIRIPWHLQQRGSKKMATAWMGGPLDEIAVSATPVVSQDSIHFAGRPPIGRLVHLRACATNIAPSVGSLAESMTALDGSIHHGFRQVIFVRGSRAAVIILAVAWLATVWRYNPNSIAYRDPQVASIMFGLLKSIGILLIGNLLWGLIKVAIQRKLEHAAPDADLAPDETARRSRLRTLLPIFKNGLAALMLIMCGLIVLSQLGFEIAPLIAGAGIFGVALVFGSQTLVKDVISGVFYMLDDAFRVGEYIQSKSYKGTVEGFSLRAVRLRHHRGPVYTVPSGELGAVQNMSRDWGVVKFRISVSYEIDVEQVRKLTKKIGVTLMDDPELGPLFIESLKMKGLEEFGEYGMNLSFGMTLRPSGLQSMARRRANIMIRHAFKENGIEFATPSVQVGGDDRQTAAAASTAARVQKQKSAEFPA